MADRNNSPSVSAIMGQSRWRVPEPPDVSATDPKHKAEKATEAKVEEDSNASLAALVTNNGWMILEKKMLKRIANFKSGSYLVDEVTKHTDSAQLGDMLKVEMKVAAQLESFIAEVHTAYSIIEQEKEKRREAIRRQHDRTRAT